MNRTTIEWCKNPDGSNGWTWNPVTGCKFNCKFGCYAEAISRRFNTDFDPTFHIDRLEQPLKVKKPSTIFVCSMGELFGDWVPDDWIDGVLDTINACPQHIFLFLTKNPSRYFAFHFPNNCWLGTTVTNDNQEIYISRKDNCFISFEPLLDYVDSWKLSGTNWIIIGTLNRNGKPISPEKGGTEWKWIRNIREEANKRGIPVFIKDSVYKAFPTTLQRYRQLPYLEGG